MYKFNVRIYGLLINELNQVLVSDEQEYGMQFTKFPGGGLEFGEGPLEGLKREFIEECNMEIEVLKHFYTTDFFLKSIFNDSQLICIYYMVKNVKPIQLTIKTTPFDFDGTQEPMQAFRWVGINELKKDHLTFPLDQHVAELIKQYDELS